MKKPLLCLIDGSSYFYRAFFAIRSLTTSKGMHINAIYGFTTMLLKVLKDLNPEYVSIVFDTAKKTFRHEIYPEYKANRTEMPQDLVEQIPFIKKVVDAFQICSLEKEGYEADDLIGTVCHRMKDENVNIVIVTADKDLMQLVNDQVILYDTMKDKKIGIEGVREKFGVSPSQVIDVLGLQGDSSDNVPGVPGIGPKTATELIQKFKSVENLLKSLDQLEGRKKEMLMKHRDEALLSKKLVTLDLNAPVHFNLASFKKENWDKNKVVELFQELEFKKLIEQLGLKTQAVERKTRFERNYKCIVTEEAFSKLLSQLTSVSKLTVDLETTSLNTREAKIVGIALAYPKEANHEALYIPIGHNEGQQLPSEKVLQALKPFLESPHIQKWGQNIKYDFLVFASHGIWLKPLIDDSMIASYILDPAGPHNMDALSLRYLDHEPIHFADVTKEGKKQVTFDYVPIDVATKYSGEDADVTYRLVELLRQKLKETNQMSLYEDVEMPLVTVLCMMEYWGVKIDTSFLKKMSNNLEEDIKIIEQDVYKLSGEEFNIQSPKQLARILFSTLKLPVKRKTKTGYSTDEGVLEALSEAHPLPAKILSYRELAKLKSTYVDQLLELSDPNTHRVHTSYNQTIAETGRLSSSDPNLQNIPIRSEVGQKIRKAFIAEKGHVFIGADYSQVELRLLAHFSEDPALVRAFQDDQDVHAETAAEVFGVSMSQVTEEMRRAAKAINFGLMYGLSAYGLSHQLKISMTDAQNYIDRYFMKYGKIRSYMDETISKAKQRGYSETLMSRRRYLPDLKSANPKLRQLAERMAINTPIQGTAADLIKIAMIRIYNQIKTQNLSTKMILQVHDELVFEVPAQELTKIKSIVQKGMEEVVVLNVPLKVDVGVGKNWGELK